MVTEETEIEIETTTEEEGIEDLAIEIERGLDLPTTMVARIKENESFNFIIK